jgi:hypothetical protein
MATKTPAVLGPAFSAIRASLADAGVAWERAWYHVKCWGKSRSASLLYTERPGGTIDSLPDRSGADELLAGLRDQLPDAAGRPWNQVFLTLHADGRREAAFDYPVPPPEPNREYTEQEVLAKIAEGVRHDLAFDRWTEAWLEADPDLVPVLSCRNGSTGPLEKSIDDCNGLSHWIGRLWKVRAESGAGPWSRFVVHILKDNDQIETEFRPGKPDAPEPPPLSPPSLGELFNRIVAAERADVADMVRRMEERGEHTGGWRRVRLTASRDGDTNVVYVGHDVEFAGGQRLDEPADSGVEEPFTELIERVEGGEDPSRLDAPGLQVQPGNRPRFTLVLTNDEPEPPKGRRQ